MLKGVNERFGNSTVITDAFLVEIQGLKPVPEGNVKKLLGWLAQRKRDWPDLEKMGQSSEIHTASMVSKVERNCCPRA